MQETGNKAGDYAVVKVNDDSFVLKNKLTLVTEEYSLFESPGDTSALVRDIKSDILGQLDLEDMLFHLELCVDLYRIVYNAVNGILDLHSTISGLRVRFSEALTDSNTVVFTYKAVTAAVVEQLLLAYQYLTVGETKTALESLKFVSQKAAALEKDSNRLIGIFTKIKEDTKTVSEKVIDKKAEYTEEYRKSAAMSSRLYAELGAQKEITALAKNRVTELTDEMSELKSDIKEQADRAFTMGIISAASGLVGGIVSSMVSHGMSDVAGAAFGKGQETPADFKTAASGNTQSPSDNTTDAAIKKRYEEENAKANGIQAEIDKIDDRIKAIDKLIAEGSFAAEEITTVKKEEKTDAQKTKAELETERDNLKNQKAGKKEELNTQKGAVESYKKQLEGMGYAFDKLSGALTNMSAKAEAKETTLRDELKQVRKMKYEADEKYAENLKVMRDLTARIKDGVAERKDLGVAIDSLIIAVGSLNFILAYLEEIRSFWSKIAAASRYLLEDSDKKSSDITKAANVTVVIRLPMFVLGYYRSVAEWVALNQVFGEYLAASESAGAKMLNTIKEPEKSAEEHWKNAVSYADELNKRVGVKIAEIKQRTDEVEKQMKADELAEKAQTNGGN